MAGARPPPSPSLILALRRRGWEQGGLAVSSLAPRRPGRRSSRLLPRLFPPPPGSASSPAVGSPLLLQPHGEATSLPRGKRPPAGSRIGKGGAAAMSLAGRRKPGARRASAVPVLAVPREGCAGAAVSSFGEAGAWFRGASPGPGMKHLPPRLGDGRHRAGENPRAAVLDGEYAAFLCSGGGPETYYFCSRKMMRDASALRSGDLCVSGCVFIAQVQ